jgi:hypothetical protein
MGQLVINLPDDTIKALEQKASINGRSLQEEVLDILEHNRPFTIDERVALTKRFHAETPDIQPALSADERREGLM